MINSVTPHIYQYWCCTEITKRETSSNACFRFGTESHRLQNWKPLNTGWYAWNVTNVFLCGGCTKLSKIFQNKFSFPQVFGVSIHQDNLTWVWRSLCAPFLTPPHSSYSKWHSRSLRGMHDPHHHQLLQVWANWSGSMRNQALPQGPRAGNPSCGGMKWIYKIYKVGPCYIFINGVISPPTYGQK